MTFKAALSLPSSSVIAGWLSRRFFRSYFALRGVQLPTVQEALQKGEGENVEFKRSFSSEDDLLESVAAFANTNDGVIFIGVDDSGHVKGLDLDFKQRDRMEQKLRQLIRTRIKPTPAVQVSFEDLRGLVIAKVTVARGDALAYLMDGVIYIRSGSSDVQAQPEDVKRLAAEFAF